MRSCGRLGILVAWVAVAGCVVDPERVSDPEADASVDTGPRPDQADVPVSVVADVGVVPPPPGRVPLNHRAVARDCDDVRARRDPGAEDWGECTAHEDCQDGINGRCIGNSHDSWYCSYDQCFADAECGGKVCECEGGFRSDHNVCLRVGDCLTDADCGAGGYCSPTLGDCGDYDGTVGYFCHTPEDDCIDDADCQVDERWEYCAYNPAAQKWSCSDAQCAG